MAYNFSFVAYIPVFVKAKKKLPTLWFTAYVFVSGSRPTISGWRPTLLNFWFVTYGKKYKETHKSKKARTNNKQTSNQEPLATRRTRLSNAPKKYLQQDHQ
eukprot:3181401-Amphidinium_carterae.1